MSKSRFVWPSWFSSALSCATLLWLTYFFWPAWYIPAAGAGLAIVVGLVMDWRRGQRAKQEGWKLLEPMFDELIRAVEFRTRPLDAIVLYNARRRNGNLLTHQLQVQIESRIYALRTMMEVEGRHAGHINVRFTVQGPGDFKAQAYYPDVYRAARPLPRLAEQLEKLQSLIGNASAYEKRRKRLSALGIDIPLRTDTPLDI
ncbi:MAG: hypothetical protein WC866_06115 [Patescibacteria group bacterium]|jgi:hypothetical protein